MSFCSLAPGNVAIIEQLVIIFGTDAEVEEKSAAAINVCAALLFKRDGTAEIN